MSTLFLTAVGLMFLAELGDKSQFLALGLSARYGAARVAIGLVLSTITTMLLAVLAGQALGALINPYVMAIVSGVLFVGFGIWTLISREDDGADEQVLGDRSGFSQRLAKNPVVRSYLTFFVAEFGDKTQLLALTLAAGASPAVLGYPAPVIIGVVTAGAAIGMIASSGLAIILGSVLGKAIPRPLVARLSAGVFMGVGAWTLAAALMSGGGA